MTLFLVVTVLHVSFIFHHSGLPDSLSHWLNFRDALILTFQDGLSYSQRLPRLLAITTWALSLLTRAEASLLMLAWVLFWTIAMLPFSSLCVGV